MTAICFCWEFMGPHHIARVRSCADSFGDCSVRAISLSDRSRVYAFYSCADKDPAVTFGIRGSDVEDIGTLGRLIIYMRHIWWSRESAFFLCHYERPEVFLTAIVLRLRGKQVFVMNDSKFDDYPRFIWKEIGKSIMYLPYSGAIVSGRRSHSYLRFLGVRGRIELGYDTISAPAAHQTVAPPVSGRFFICVCRLVERKNVAVAIRAFAAVIRDDPGDVTLLIVGNGPEEGALRGLCADLGIDGSVIFLGERNNDEVCGLIAQAVALLLLSTSEQWGLTINEAIVCDVPVVVSDAVGARDELVRNFVNGYVVEPDNVAGIARAMRLVLECPHRLHTPSDLADAATVGRFAEGVRKLVTDR